MLTSQTLFITTGAILLLLLTGDRQQHQALRHTSLQGTGIWIQIAKFSWIGSAFTSIFCDPSSPILDQLWYWTAILTLCPFIAVLGARRPASRVWDFFIIIPLIAVLGWPALTVWQSFPDLPPLRLQSPVFVGIGLVLIMGVGNYFGTRFCGAAVLIGAAVVLAVLPVWSLLSLTPEQTAIIRLVASGLVAAGIVVAHRQAARETSEESPYDRLWFDFRDTFGIVWAIRIQERINATAEKEGWAARLGPLGFHWPDDEIHPSSLNETLARMDHTLRWLLRRFVDPEWIDRRLGESRVQSPESRVDDARASGS